MTSLFSFNENQKYFYPEIPEDISSAIAYNRVLNYGEAFAYLYRRFGNPSGQEDRYKDLAIYYLTTPMESVALAVFPHHENYPFKCLVSNEVNNRLYQERQVIIDEFEARFNAWCKENNKTVFSRYHWQNTPEQLDYLNSWLIANNLKHYTKTDDELPREIANKFLCESQAEFRSVRDYYFDNVETLRNISGDFHKEVQAALMVTIKDLLTPVNIRDWQINILGKLE